MIIQRRLILTAGHCVYDFANGQAAFMEDFVFVPAHDRGSAPFGAWDWAWVRVSDSWFDGDGSLPNAADFAIIQLRDRLVRGRRLAIGDVIGWLGWMTNAEINHVTQLGYPFNLDQGERMQVTHSVLLDIVFPNAFTFGSDQSGGSSGGPIVQDFGVPALGQPEGAVNQVVSVVSFGSDPRRELGGSVLNGEFLDLFERGCARRPDNCVR